MAIYLVVNADDFGISAGVSRGILEAYHKGIVTSTTVMVNMPDAADSIRLAQETAPRLGVGLHLNLSFGAPALPPERVSSLVTSTGRFVSTYEQLTAKAPLFDFDEVYAEFCAQFERFVAIAGRAPDHLDSHHDVSFWHPAGFDAMLNLAEEHHLPIRSPEMYLDEEKQTILARHARPVWPTMIVPETPFFDKGVTLDALRAILFGLPDGVHELVCHPGHPEGLIEAYAGPREHELRVITDPAARGWIAERSIHLISFSDLP